MYVIVVGCGRVGAELSHRLFQDGHEVAVVDERGASFRNLPAEFRGRTIEGNVLSKEVLERVEIARAQGLAAVTSSDSVNAVVGHVARAIYGIDNVVVRNFDPRLLPLHVGFHHRVVSSTVWGAERIETLLHHPEEESLLAFASGSIEMFELRLPVRWWGRTVGDLVAGLEASPVTLTRGGRTALARLETRLLSGDVLHVAGTRDAYEELERRLSGTEGS
jgi:trk system potassium uptake protein TrkA